MCYKIVIHQSRLYCARASETTLFHWHHSTASRITLLHAGAYNSQLCTRTTTEGRLGTRVFITFRNDSGRNSHVSRGLKFFTLIFALSSYNNKNCCYKCAVHGALQRAEGAQNLNWMIDNGSFGFFSKWNCITFINAEQCSDNSNCRIWHCVINSPFPWLFLCGLDIFCEWDILLQWADAFITVDWWIVIEVAINIKD